jgi:hypothetical protein
MTILGLFTRPSNLKGVWKRGISIKGGQEIESFKRKKD